MESLNKITSELEVRYKSDVPEGARRDKTILEDLKESSQKTRREEDPEAIRQSNRKALTDRADELTKRRTAGGKASANQERISELRSEIDAFDKSPVAQESRKKLESLVSGGVTDPARRKLVVNQLRDSLAEQMREITNMRARVSDASVPLLAGERETLTGQLDEAQLGVMALGDSLNKVSEITKRAALPQYFTAVATAAISAATTMVSYYKAGELGFDLSSAQGMYNAQAQAAIQRTKIASSGVGSLMGVGLAGGTLAAAAIAGAPFSGGASLMALFAGLSIGGMAGGAMGEWITTEPEKQLKKDNAMLSRSQSNVMGFLPLQSKLKDISVLSGMGDSATDSLAKSYTERGYSTEQAAQLASGVLQTSGRLSKGTMDALTGYKVGQRFEATGLTAISRYTGKDVGKEDIGFLEVIAKKQGLSRIQKQEMIQSIVGNYQMAGSQFVDAVNMKRSARELSQLPSVLFTGEHMPEWAKNQEGRQQIFQGFSALTNPKSEAERAFMFSALHKEGSSFIDTSLRMREGIFGKGNLSDILKALPKGQEQAYLMALTEGKGVNTGAVREMMKQLSGDNREKFMDNWTAAEGRSEDMQKHLNAYGGAASGTATKGELQVAEISVSKMDAAQKSLDVVLDNLKTFELKLNNFSSNPAALQGMFDRVNAAWDKAMGLSGGYTIGAIGDHGVAPSPETPRQREFSARLNAAVKKGIGK